MNLTDVVRREYEDRFKAMKIKPDKVAYIDQRVDRLLKVRPRYEAMAKETGVPWFVIAVIDHMESGGGCIAHLHNGDSLKARTKNVPKGRPLVGSPPFTWDESARDALAYDGLTKWKDWSVAGICYKLEGFNGFGYRKRGKPSPYLYSFATLPGWDGRGKFIRDGVYSASAVSDQIGAVVLLKRMHERKLITF
jgi:lysozyme family protein